jgi:hypothetical protein
MMPPMMRMNAVAMVVALVVGCSSTPSGTSGADAPAAAKCGDGICAVSEVDTCPQDCGTRGSGSAVTGNPCNLDGTCEPNIGENAINCPSDCTAGSGSAVIGSGSSSTGVNCSDAQVIMDCTMCLDTFGGDCGMTGETNCLSCVGL